MIGVSATTSPPPSQLVSRYAVPCLSPAAVSVVVVGATAGRLQGLGVAETGTGYTLFSLSPGKV